MTIEFKHQGRPNQYERGVLVKGSTWEFWWPSVQITYDIGGLSWPDGATCFVYPTESATTDVVSLTTAYLHWSDVTDKTGWSNYEIQYSDDAGAHWKTVESTATGWMEKNGELVPTGLVTVSGAPLIVSVPAWGLRRLFRVRGIASAGESYNTPWLYSTNALKMGMTDPDICTDIAFRENPCEETTIMSFVIHPGINNPISQYLVMYCDSANPTGEDSWTGDPVFLGPYAESDIARDSYALNPNAGSTRYMMVNAPARNQYRQFWIKAYGANGGETGWSAASVRLTRLFSAPSQPGTPKFTYNPAIGTQPITWRQSTNGAGNTVTKYRLQYADASPDIVDVGERNWQDAGLESTGNSVWIPEPPLDKVRYYRVQAVGSGGLDSEWSASSSPLINSRLLFQGTAHLIWQPTFSIDLAFARQTRRTLHLLMYAGDRYATAVLLRTQYKGEPYIYDVAQWFNCACCYTPTGEVFRSQGFGEGDMAMVPLPLEVTDAQGAYEGTIICESGDSRTPMVLMDFISKLL